MEVIVVTRKYSQWEDSYTKILGVCKSDELADALIEIDKHKDDHQKMSKTSWFNTCDYCVKRREDLIHNENCGKKKGGFLKRFNYDGLNKVAKHAYDELLKKYDGRIFDSHILYEMTDEDEFYLYQIFDKDLTKITFEDYTELDHWYSCREHSENPDDIYYKKERFILND